MLPFNLSWTPKTVRQQCDQFRQLQKSTRILHKGTITKSVEKQVQKNFIDVDVISDGISHDDEECIIELLIMTEWW